MKKLIEVAMPLDIINEASAREKSIRHGHPSTLHLWWSRKPTATARAVLFASIVDDPSEHPELFPTPEVQDAERQRLFQIIEELVKWENCRDNKILNAALLEMLLYTKERTKTKKLIEVAMPLDVVNEASAREKSIRHGHPSTLHLWWARRPSATARAVLFASIVDDPSEHPELFPTPEAQDTERQRLFKLIKELVKWENSGNEQVIAQAVNEMKRYGADLPAVFDPFAGGGSIPLEAQRLGLKAFAADLNPVAVIINKAMIELPAKFKDKPPVNPTANKLIGGYQGAEGLAEDINYYGKLLKARAFKELAKLYPTADGKTVIAWLWARTVTCSNPACQKAMPLVHSFKLSTRQNIFARPVVDGDNIRFEICADAKDIPDGTVNRNGARCLHCGANVPLAHIRNEAKAGNMHAQLMAIVAEGARGRIYLPPDSEHESAANVDKPENYPDGELPDKALGFRVQEYGINEWHQLFTNRQLKALTTFSNLIPDIQSQVQSDGGSKDYADAITVYLAFLIDKLALYGNFFCMWHVNREIPSQIFGRQGIQIVWIAAETNPFSDSSGCFDNMLEWIYKSVKELPAKIVGEVINHSALSKFPINSPVIVSTDPPYYDNIGYANLSEFFYVWLRRSLRKIYPALFGRMSFGKNEELIAEPARHANDKSAAKDFFEDGMFQALKNVYDVAREDYPVTIYYAFKQQESDSASTGWETMLTSIIRAGFQITATLPMRTEMGSRMRSHESNALASSIVLACRKRPLANKFLGKREFTSLLKKELREALDKLTSATIAPVDMAQASIGPGISVYSRYERIADMNDNELTIREALQMINAELAEYFGTQTGKLDAVSQFCADVFTQSGFNEISFGEADVLARAKNISVDKMAELGAVITERGQIRLRDRNEMPVLDAAKQLNRDWLKKLAASDCVWLWVQSAVEVFDKLGFSGCGELLTHYEGNLESLKNLAYRLYNICEKKHRASEGRHYNEFVMSWQDTLRSRNEFMQNKPPKPEQSSLFEEA